MRHTTKVVVLVAAVLGAIGLAGAGWAYWSTSGTGTASAGVGTLDAPEILSHSAANGTVSLGWTAVTPPASGPVGYYVLRDGSPASAACGGPSSTISTTSCSDTVAASGQYSYTVTAVFRSWTATSGAASVEVVLDTTPPTATVTFPANATRYSASGYAAGCTPTGICGSASDASGVLAVAVSILQQSSGYYWSGLSFSSPVEVFQPVTLVTPGAVSTAWRYSLAQPADGSYTLHLQATDNAANTATGTTSFVVDTTGPAVTVNPTATPTANNRPAFSGGYASAAGDLASVTVSVYGGADTTGVQQGSTMTADLDTTAHTWSSWALASALADGTYTVAARQTDAVGNVGLATFTFNVDRQAPTATIAKAATQADPTNTLPVNFTVTFSEPVTGFASSGLVLGGTAPGARSAVVTGSGTTYNIAVSGPSGSGTVSAAVSAAAAHDAAGNDNSASGSAQVTYDSSAPVVSGVSSTKADGSYTTGAVIPVTVTFNEPVTVTGTPRLTLATGGTGTAVNYTGGSGTTTLVFTYTVATGNVSPDLDYASSAALALGGGTIKDAASNDAVLTLASPGTAGSLAAGKAIVIDTTPPSASAMSVSCAFANGSNYTCSGTYASASGDLSSSLSVTIYNASTNAVAVAAATPSTISGGAWNSSGSGPGRGTYYAKLTQSDSAGNATTVQSPNFSR